jgi:cation:H+ antiporter
MTLTDWFAALRLFGGVMYLAVGGDLLVRGALGISRRAAISPLIVGLTVVALGTSAPELVVSLHSAFSGFAGLSIGNVVGSNIANVLIVLGAPALIYPARPDKKVGRQAAFMLAISVVFGLLCLHGPLGLLQGGLLVALLVMAMVLTARGGGMTMPGVGVEEAEEELRRVLGLPNEIATIALFILGGSASLGIGAHLTVDGAVTLGARFGVSDAVMGATLVALGTSLPELATTIIAAFHKSSDVAFGNVIGSNVLNILGIMGITALLIDVPVPAALLDFDLWVMLGAAVLLWWITSRGIAIGRRTGCAFLLAYLAYYVVLF